MGIGAGLAGQWGIADEVYTNEVQQISGTPSVPFTISYDGATTAVLATNASAAQIQAALEALPNIGTAGVSATGGALPTAVVITFSGALVAGRNLPAVTINTATGVTVATNTPGTGFGDYVAPTQFNEIISSKQKLGMERIKSVAIRAGNTVQRIDRKVPNKTGASAPVSLEVPTKGFSKINKGIYGKAPTITTPANGVLTRKHSFTLGDTRNISQTIQTGVPTVLGDANNVKAISSMGCKVTSASFKLDLDGLFKVDIDYDAMDETDAQALAAASFATSDVFSYLGAAVVLGGMNLAVTKLQLDIKPAMATARRFLRGSSLKKQQILNGMREVSGTVGVEFESTALYDKFASSTLAGALTPITFTITGPQIEAVTPTYSHQHVIAMPQCDIVGSTPTLDGPDLVMVDIPFEVCWDGSVEPITHDIYTTDTTS